MLEKPVYITNKGLLELQAELAHMQEVKRPEVLERLQESRGAGDWMDNAEYMLVAEELAYVDGRIQELVYMLDHAQLIGPDNEDDTVDVGETVVVQVPEGDLETYTIVGVAEADPGRGFISNESPLGRALLDHKVGETVVVNAPVGELHVRIISLKSAKKPGAREANAG